MNFIMMFTYLGCALMFFVLVDVLLHFYKKASPVCKLWYKRGVFVLMFLAVLYVIMAVVSLFVNTGIWGFIVPIVVMALVMLSPLLPMVVDEK